MAILGPPGTPKNRVFGPPREGGETPQNGHFGGIPPSPPFWGVLAKTPQKPYFVIWLRRE